LIAPVLKTGEGASLPGVRIPPCPPTSIVIAALGLSVTGLNRDSVALVRPRMATIRHVKTSVRRGMELEVELECRVNNGPDKCRLGLEVGDGASLAYARSEAPRSTCI
jgi:hypothetical protein